MLALLLRREKFQRPEPSAAPARPLPGLCLGPQGPRRRLRSGPLARPACPPAASVVHRSGLGVLLLSSGAESRPGAPGPRPRTRAPPTSLWRLPGRPGPLPAGFRTPQNAQAGTQEQRCVRRAGRRPEGRRRRQAPRGSGRGTQARTRPPTKAESGAETKRKATKRETQRERGTKRTPVGEKSEDDRETPMRVETERETHRDRERKGVASP